jgi:hypothetical protein
MYWVDSEVVCESCCRHCGGFSVLDVTRKSVVELPGHSSEQLDYSFPRFAVAVRIAHRGYEVPGCQLASKLLNGLAPLVDSAIKTYA